MTSGAIALILGLMLLKGPALAADAAQSPSGRGKLTVRSDVESCKVLYVGIYTPVELDLEIPAPCSLNSLSGAVRFLDTPRGSIALVENSVPNPDIPGSCQTKVRGILIEKNGEVSLSPHIATVANCLPADWDEKMFLGLFER